MKKTTCLSFTFSIFKTKSLSFIFFLILVSGFTNVNAQLVHPGISHKLSDLDRMKYMVEAGIEPYATSFTNLKNHSRAQYTYPVNVVNQDPSYVTEYSEASDAWFINDGTAAYYNALMWYITGDSRHAEKAIEIFNTWKGLKRNSMSVPLSSGRIWRIIEAAEIIEHTYNGWAAPDVQAFKDMLVYPGYSATTEPTAALNSGDITFYWRVYQGDPARHGNQGLFCMRTMMAMAIFLDNDIMYDRALRYLQGYSHRTGDLAYPSGPSINETTNISGCDYFEEYKRTGSGTSIPDYGYNEVVSNYIYENGQCQESSRDQAHGLAGVSTIAVMAEMAWNQGDDLYGHLNNRPLLGLEFYYRYNLSYDNVYPDQSTPWEPTVASGEFIERTDRSGRWKSLKVNPYLVCSTGEDFRERGKHSLQPVYEMNLGHYKDRLGLPSDDYKWLQRGFDYLTAQSGVEGEGTVTDHPGYGGLKFRRVSPGDPISGFDGNGLPMYKMNELPMVIEAENYDFFVLNGEGRVYSDNATGNSGNAYRLDENVDIEVSSEGGYNLTDIENGEWLTYTINVPSNGTYDINIRYASANANGKIKFNFGGEDVTLDVTVPFGGPNSTGLTDWQNFKVGNVVTLKKGVQAVKILFNGTSDAFKLNSFTVSLVEVEPEPINLAITHGTATQSTDRPSDGFAPNAIDGNTNGVWNNGSVSHTGGNATSDPAPWWKVDLGNNYKIETINVFNRTDCCSDRLNNFTVEVLDANGSVTFSQFYATVPSNAFTVNTGNVIGRTVRISKTSSTALTLAEVEVYGVDAVVLSSVKYELDQVKIHPNPVQNEINISLISANINIKEAKITMYSLNGQIVMQTKLGSNQVKLDVSKLSRGVYVLTISDSTKNITRKIVKL
ncbi:carbohydrate-binding protein [Mariniflexile sp. AS56]|uniref:galactose-binding domain-containing protein n=1 Tax=Mariniflexile sp. AS56 TaxID=3063957 RepID=UPI0026EEA073|nr:carbohydrate-binding protein [Mariniflexile sp. AS56]MDO7171623.1 carbohydrate-binding protein [Mariniflexile sp. AS56]